MQQPMQQPMQPPMQPQGMAAGGIIRMAEGRTTPATVGSDSYKGTTRLAQEANNLIGVRQYGFDWEGERGTVETDYGNFVNYNSPEFSLRTGDMTLANYGKPTTEQYGRGFNTLSQVINQYSPQQGSATVGGETISYQNPTSNYLNFVSQKTGIDPNEEINLGDPATRASILSAIAAFESNTNISPAQVSEQLLVANQKIQQSKNPLRSLVPDVQVPGVDASIPEMAALPSRQGVVTTESVDLPSQELPLSKEFIEKYLNDSNFRFEMDSAKRYAQEDADEIAAKNPQSPDELMAATFGDRQTPDVAPSSRQGAVSRLPELDGALPQTMRQPTGSEPGDVIRLAEQTKVDPKGLITTDNQPVSAIIEDAAKGDAYVPMQGPAIKMPTAPEEELSIVDRINRFLAPPEATEEQKEFARNRRPRRSRGPYGMNMSGVGAADAKPVDYEEVGDLVLQGVGLSPPTTTKKDTGPSISQEQQDLAEANIALNAQQGAQQVDDNQKTVQTAQQQADQYIADARKAREEGLITKEDLAKKEALGAALIQLGAGIAKGDFAEGLSKAGVAAQDVREKARDRAVKARYYDSLAESRTGNTPQNLRRLQQAVADQLKKEFPQGMMADEAAYLARQKELLDQVSASFGIDVSALSATPADPTAAAEQSATPATSRYAFD
tara:strand:- start:2427 stop:4430 length:2004 start_codon:yes stop_codon:yes gene_type:complete